MTTTHANEIAAGQRFEFGANWLRFLERLDDRRVATAEQSLRSMLGVQELTGKTFLDAGSGSGLFSLAARRLGAIVHSFDYDPQSVACTREVKRRYADGDPSWVIEEGSVLDRGYLARLGTFDIVYSWGVLHHTGAMWDAMANVAALVKPGGRLFISIYNDQGRASAKWRSVKRLYCTSPRPVRAAVLGLAFARLWGPTVVRDTLRGRPGRSLRAYGARGDGRGMTAWRDLVDWVGGYPFEVARPEDVFTFCRDRGFALDTLRTCGGGLGCNQFVFTRRLG